MPLSDVVFLPFQVSALDEGSPHLKLLNGLTATKRPLCIVLPVRRFPGSADSPLDFNVRRAMILDIYPQDVHPQIRVIPLPDQKYFDEQVAALHLAVAEVMDTPTNADHTLYTSSAYMDVYCDNGGSWTCIEIQKAEEYERMQRRTCTDEGQKPDLHEAFRRGMICAFRRLYPINWMTVDIAITRKVPGQGVLGHRTQVLLGKKPGDRKWRFPGGYKDRSDHTLEMTARREAFEETKSTKLSEPRYLGSQNIQDWRYRGERDGITTTMYETECSDTVVEAGDDLIEVEWFEVEDLEVGMMEAEHVPLLQLFLEKRH